MLESQQQQRKNPSNADAFSALETAMEWYEQQSECCPTQLLLLKRMRDLAGNKRRKYNESRLVDHARFNDETGNANHNDCEVEGTIASPRSIPPERAISPTGERRDEGRNIRTRQNPLGPQERQMRIGRAVITLKK
ncbi:hypothetical protein TNCV_775361 [Trichonephila clavipes]|nr:hypothetical protein TNCV_775361 [Trichonephila clavipes]